MKSKLLLLLFLTFLLTLTAGAQSDTTEVTKDTADVEDWDSWEEWEDFDFEVHVFEDEFRGAPTIYLSYGWAEISRTDMDYKFADPRSFQLKLGKTYQHDLKEDSRILKYRMSFLFLDNVTTELAPEADNAIMSESWRFGIGRSTGYGYKIGSAAIIPFNSNSFTWTRLDADESLANLDAAVIPVVERYNNLYCFGNTTEAGIKIQIIPAVSVEPSFERTIVYERHLFWKWGGSMLIELVGQSLIDEFVEEIIDSSPYAGPAVNFLLKNAFSYGMYELRKEQMNWPFPSAPGLLYDQFKIGMTFVF